MTPTQRRLRREYREACDAVLAVTEPSRGTHGYKFSDGGAAWEIERKAFDALFAEDERLLKIELHRERKNVHRMIKERAVFLARLQNSLDSYVCCDYTEQREARAERMEEIEDEWKEKMNRPWP